MSSKTESDQLPLDASRDEVLERVRAMVSAAWTSFDTARPGQPAVSDTTRATLQEPLPETPRPVMLALDDAATILDESIAQARPRFFAFVGSSGLPIGVMADALVACFDANMAVHAGAATDIEEQALRWVGEFIGFPVGGGAITSGGTVSNLTALAAARERALPGSRESGMAGQRAAIYSSAEAHHSVIRASEVLGIGRSSVRMIPVDPERRMRPGLLAAAIDADRAAGTVPVAVVATAGTTLTGAVDPIEPLASICRARGVWLHVDGAYGLPTAGLPELRPLFAGLELADSVSLDAHKWLYLPKPCGVILVRHREDLSRSFAHDEGYLPHERGTGHPVDRTLEYSRPFGALKLWLALRVHGAHQFRQALRENLAQARLLHATISQHPEMDALGVPQLSIVPFRHVPPNVADLDTHNRQLAQEMQEDGRVYVAPAEIDGHAFLRPCFVNFRTRADDVAALVSVAHELGVDLACRGSPSRRGSVTQSLSGCRSGNGIASDPRPNGSKEPPESQ